LITGLGAWQQSRLHPTEIITDAWDRMDLQPLARKGIAARHAADIVLSHARSLYMRMGIGPLPLVWVVPGHYTRDQLGVLLGVAQSLRVTPGGLVDAGTAAISTAPRGAFALHLDLLLNRFNASLYSAEAGELRRLGCRSATRSGLWQLYQTLLKALSRQFVLQTRFDPTHDAAAEQALFGEIPALLLELSGDEQGEVSLNHRGKLLKAGVHASSLASVAAPLVHEWLGATQELLHEHQASGTALDVYLSDRLAGVPGLESALQTLGDIRLRWLPFAASARGALALASGGGAEGSRLITRRTLAGVKRETTVTVSAPVPAIDQPTHVLVGTVAYSLAGRGCHLSLAAGEPEFKVTLDPGEGGAGLKADAQGALMHVRDTRICLDGNPVVGVVPLRNGQRITLSGTSAKAKLIRTGVPQ
jgi:hypothetical protein